MLGAVKGAVSYLIEGIKILSINYYQTAKEKGDFEIQEAVMQVLEMFGLNNYRMVSRVMLSITGSSIKNKISNDLFDLDFYSNGFRFYEFSEHKVSALKTKIDFYEMKDTPEHFLITLASKAYVVGLSATGNIQTVLGNYNLKYIKEKIGDRFYTLSQQDIDRSNKLINERLNINKAITKVIPVESNSDILSSFFKDIEYGIALEGEIDKTFDDNKDFLKIKLFNVLSVIDSFIYSDNKALLVLTNRNVHKDNHVFSEKNFNRYFEYKKYEDTSKKLDNIKCFYMDSNNFDDRKKEYINELQSGNRVILISSYQTVGVGQNLQYKIGKNEYDIDALYIEKPTNLVVDSNKFNKDSYSDLMKYIYQIESLKENGELYYNEASNSIVSGFYKKYNIIKRIENKIYESESLQFYAISILIQAVGRICRTNDVVQNKTIYVDKDIFREVDLSKIKDKRVNYEFEAIINMQNELKILESKIERDSELIIAQNNNRAIASKLKFEARTGWNEEKISWWKELRYFVLKHPTISTQELSKYPQYKNLYVSFKTSSNCYYFNHENDYSDIDLRLTKSDLKDEMSETNCRLDVIMKNPIVKKHFEDNGYCTSFYPNENLLLPAVYNNVYKGALGEIVGEFILKHYGINIEYIKELNEYEKFDYKLNDLYFDFKLMKNTGYDINYTKVRNKLNLISGKEAIIINTLGDNKMLITNNENVLTIPALLDENTGEVNKKAIDKLYSLIGGNK